jgi:hypothetical protein
VASVGWSWGGIVVSLSDSETQTLLNAWDKLSQIKGMIPGLDPKAALALSLYFWVYANWISWAKSFGRGIYVTLPWASIWWGQYWLIWVWPR